MILRWVVIYLSLIKLIEFDVDVEEKIGKYQGEYEINETLDL
jgi:hypothetical protein